MNFWSYIFKTNKKIPNRTSNQIIGERAERLAEQYLTKQGLKIIGRNILNSDKQQKGEIDLLCKDGQITVFVEVRYRKQGSWVSAGKSINSRKKTIIQKTARKIMHKMGIIQARIDAILIDEGKEIIWVKNLT